MEFDTNKTISIIFDTEWYVPLTDRSTSSSFSSLKVNPAKPDHKYLGGVFYRFFPLNKKGNTQREQFWVNDLSKDEEKRVLSDSYSFFKKTWQMIEGKNSNVPDLVTLGTGITRLDLPGLYTKCQYYAIDSKDILYETLMKTRAVDLSDVAIPFFNRGRPEMLYPITTNSIVGRLKVNAERKNTGKSVWEMVDTGDIDAVKRRTSEEVDTLIKIYDSMVKHIFH